MGEYPVFDGELEIRRSGGARLLTGRFNLAYPVYTHTH